MWGTRTLRALAGLCAAMSLVFPAINVYVVYPAFQRLLIRSAEEDAVRVASHLGSSMKAPEAALDDAATIAALQDVEYDFRLWKLKVFDAGGKVTYSSDSKDVGTVNDKPYFRNVVARGGNYSLVVKKSGTTLEGQVVSRDVVEAYVPLMGPSGFGGAFEVYYDVTDRLDAMEAALWRFSAGTGAVVLGFLGVLTVLFAAAGREAARRGRAEAALQRANDSLESRVEERTAELRESHGRLEEEMAERQAMERSLRESEQRYRALFESAGEAIFILGAEGPEAGRVVAANRAAAELYGYAPGSAFDRTWSELEPAGRGEGAALLRGALSGGWVQGEIEQVRRDGTTFPAECSLGQFSSDDSRHVLAFVRDESAKRRTEDELVKAQKLESLAVLAGGIAHDFNNILAGIAASLDGARLLLSPADPALEGIDRAAAAALRARGLTQQLLTFSAGGAPVKAAVASLAETVREAADFGLRGSNVRCEYALAPDLWPAEVDVGQIGQVVDNLVINALQAMPEGGTVRVEASNVLVGADAPLPLNEGRYVRLSVADAGSGVPEGLRSKIFDPFFTTKEKGTGLGLSTSYSIVRNHHGCIALESEVGRGATFHVYLPALEAGAPRDAGDRDEGGQASGTGLGGTRILLMDDDPLIRDAVTGLLRHAGCRPEAAADGQEAVDRYRQAAETGTPFDAVIMDLTVPGGMGGKEAAARLLAFDSDARIIVSSGYSTDAAMADFRSHGFRDLIPKPYKLADLLAVLERVLEPPASGRSPEPP